MGDVISDVENLNIVSAEELADKKSEAITELNERERLYSDAEAVVRAGAVGRFSDMIDFVLKEPSKQYLEKLME